MSRTPSSPHGWRIGSVGGVPLYIGRTWPILVLVLLAMWLPRSSHALAEGLVSALVALTSLMLSVLLHEGAHALAAARTGQRVDRIVADLWGGHTVYDASVTTPGRDALVAVVGPLSNLALAGIAHLALGALPDGAPWPLLLLVGSLRFVNLFVGLFNLLPGLPLDGGQLVASAVWAVTRDRFRGVVAAGWCGRAVAALAAVWFVGRPLVQRQVPDSTMLWSLLICGFLWHGASQAITVGRVHRTRSLPLAQVADPAVLVPHSATVREAVALAQTADDRRGVPVLVGLDEAGAPLGVIAADPAGLDPTTPFVACVQVLPAGWVVRAPGEGTAGPAIDALAETDAPAVLVLPEVGAPVVVRLATINRVFHGRT